MTGPVVLKREQFTQSRKNARLAALALAIPEAPEAPDGLVDLVTERLAANPSMPWDAALLG